MGRITAYHASYELQPLVCGRSVVELFEQHFTLRVRNMALSIVNRRRGYDGDGSGQQ